MFFIAHLSGDMMKQERAVSPPSTPSLLERVPMAKAPKFETSARHLLVGALGFMDAAQRLLDPDPRGGPLLWPPFFVLVAYSFEMSFKAVVRQAGGSEADLKAIGHDLERGLAAARAAGYQEPHGLPIGEALAALGPLHMDHSLRYFMGPPDRVVDLHEPDDVMGVLRAHLATVRAMVPV